MNESWAIRGVVGGAIAIGLLISLAILSGITAGFTGGKASFAWPVLKFAMYGLNVLLPIAGGLAFAGLMAIPTYEMFK